MAKTKADKLTAKEEAFVQALVAGESQRQAYKIAYPKSRMKETTMDTEACKLFKKPKITARYNELMEEHKQKALYTREDAVLDLIWLKETAKQHIVGFGVQQNANAFINAIKEIAKFEDLYPKEAGESKEDKLDKFLGNLEDIFKE